MMLRFYELRDASHGASRLLALHEDPARIANFDASGPVPTLALSFSACSADGVQGLLNAGGQERHPSGAP